MDFLQELEWRKMLHQSTPGIEEALQKGMVTGYIGFDPTAPSLTIGNYVQLMVLSLFQKAGHQPIVLMGGATGRIGDPSFKDEERSLKSDNEIETNLRHQLMQMKKFINFEEGDNRAILVNNFDFYKDMNALSFLRDVGKTLTVNYMMSKESVKKRIETGISFTEFSYQLLQGYDFQCLYQQHNCTLQMGGSDQWGNITTGTEFVRRNAGGKAFAITSPLLTKADGSKFGKSEKGNIWLDPTLTSPFEFYQFWIRCSDEDLPNFLRYFTLKSKEEIEAIEKEHADNPNAMKAILAEELTRRIHSDEDFETAKKVSNLLFKKADKETLLSLDANALAMVAKAVTSISIEKSKLEAGIPLSDLLTEYSSILASKGDVRRSVKNNAISINKDKVTNFETMITAEMLLHDTFIMIENGKKNKYMVLVK